MATARPQLAQQSAAVKTLVVRRAPTHGHGCRLGHHGRVERLGRGLASAQRDLDAEPGARPLLVRPRGLGGCAAARDLKLLLCQRGLGALVLQLAARVGKLAREEARVGPLGLGLGPRRARFSSGGRSFRPGGLGLRTQ